MCGIAGLLLTTADTQIDRDLLASMNTTLAHRGPDGEGLFAADGVGLAHRRLAIIDLAAGRQPLFNEDGNVVVVFNGEIYNFAELGRELAGRGHVLATRSDTEVIVHAWEEWGEGCVDHLRGMFAFALWDRRQRRLFLARDRLGIKPLYYAELPDGTLLFGSELKALLVHPDLPRVLDPAAIEEYLAFGYIPDPRTILRDARKLPPGHVLTVDQGRAVPPPRCYWRPQIEPGPSMNAEVAVEELLERLDATVGAHLVADVPVGAFLSGGIDSSAVVAAMSQIDSSQVETCSIGFREAAFDESEHAARVATHCNSRHHTEIVTADGLDSVDHLTRLYDEPFADSSAIPTSRLSALARRHVTVALSGDGGDEAFAGYPWYGGHLRNERLRRLLPAGVRRALCPSLAAMLPARHGRALGKLALDSVDAFAFSTMITTPDVRARLLAPSLRRELQGYDAREVVRRHAGTAASTDALALAQHIDIGLYLPGDILTKVDRASMAHGLEVRVPLLDHEFVNWASTLPGDLKWRGGRGKYLLCEAATRRVPRTLLERPKKGFSVPLADWFRGPLRPRIEHLATDQRALVHDLLAPGALARTVREHVDGHADHGTLLWALLMLDECLYSLTRVPRPADPTRAGNYVTAGS